MSYSCHTDFFLKDLLTSNNPNGENYKKVVPKQRESGLQEEILEL